LRRRKPDSVVDHTGGVNGLPGRLDVFSGRANVWGTDYPVGSRRRFAVGRRFAVDRGSGFAVDRGSGFAVGRRLAIDRGADLANHFGAD